MQRYTQKINKTGRDLSSLLSRGAKEGGRHLGGGTESSSAQREGNQNSANLVRDAGIIRDKSV